MVVRFASEDNVVSIKPVRFKKHEVTDDAVQEMRAIKRRAKFSRSLSPERVQEDAVLRASQLARKAKKYNQEPVLETNLPHSLCDDDVVQYERQPAELYAELIVESDDDEDPPILTANDSPCNKAATSRSRTFTTLKMRCSSLFSSRASLPANSGKKPSVFASMRSRISIGRSRSTGHLKKDGDNNIPRVSSDHVSFDSIFTPRTSP